MMESSVENCECLVCEFEYEQDFVVVQWNHHKSLLIFLLLQKSVGKNKPSRFYLFILLSQKKLFILLKDFFQNLEKKRANGR